MIFEEQKKSLADAFDDELTPDADRVIFGLRDTGYNFNTAIADIVDNSITANATKVDISININPLGEITVYICDNGCGMDAKGLRNAMRYGSNAREDKKSLSKFGLGLKTASTSFCRCLSLISRTSASDIRKIQWDLDYIASVNKWKPLTPNPTRDEVKILNSIAGDGSGTLVVWSKVDRLLMKGVHEYANKTSVTNAIKTKKDKLRRHLGLTFQRFIDPAHTECPNIEITIDMVPVDAIDPFCLSETDEEVGTIKYSPPKPLNILLDEDDPTSAHPVSLVAYVLPRQVDFSTPKAKEAANISNSTEGFYVYRENRLIHYGDWLGMFTNEPHYSLLRVEFSFGAELDDAFNVDIKKSRILPAEEIIDWIQNRFIGPPRRAANDRYRKGQAKKVSGKSKELNAHSSSNKSIDDKAAAVEESTMVQVGTDEVELTNANGTFRHKIEIVSAPRAGEVRILPVEEIEYGNLWKPCIADGKHAIKLNTSHPFYQKVYYPVLGQNVMVTGIDALLWALAESENSTVNPLTAEYYEDMRISVSKQLKKLIADLPEPQEE